MQTFLPVASFRDSAKSLDYKRLGKQRSEVKQIYNAIVLQTGWHHHPAVKMWENNVDALLHYGMACCVEWCERGYKDSLWNEFFMNLDIPIVTSKTNYRSLSGLVVLSCTLHTAVICCVKTTSFTQNSVGLNPQRLITIGLAQTTIGGNMKVYSLVTTDTSYLDVSVFPSEEVPTVDELLKQVDFNRSEALCLVLEILLIKIKPNKDDYAVASFDDCGLKYMFHLKCHGEYDETGSYISAAQ